MKLIDLLENTPSTGIGAWPKTFRNISAAQGDWCSFLRYNNDCTFQVSKDGNVWESTKGYWMFLPQNDWEVYSHEQSWTIVQAIKRIYGNEYRLCITHDLWTELGPSYTFICIRRNGYGAMYSQDFNVSCFKNCPSDFLEQHLLHVVSKIREAYSERTHLRYSQLPQDLGKIKSLLGL